MIKESQFMKAELKRLKKVDKRKDGAGNRIRSLRKGLEQGEKAPQRAIRSTSAMAVFEIPDAECGRRNQGPAGDFQGRGG